MKITLRSHTPLHIAAASIRECWASGEKSDSLTVCTVCGAEDWLDEDNYCTECDVQMVDTVTGPNDKSLINRVANKFKHASTLEHLVYNFHIEGVSRALLQELARHRMASPSVKSSRYTLKELKDEVTDLAVPYYHTTTKDLEEELDVYKKYIVFTGNDWVDLASCRALGELQSAIQEGISNDIAKYCLPEAYKTSLSWTVNARSLQNFIALRSHKSALWEIRDLAKAIYSSIPSDHKYLFEDSLYKEQ